MASQTWRRRYSTWRDISASDFERYLRALDRLVSVTKTFEASPSG